MSEAIVHYLFYDLQQWMAYEKRALAKIARVIVVAPESVDRVADLGVPRDRIELVSNTLNIPHFESFGLDDDILQKYTPELTLLPHLSVPFHSIF